MGIKPLQCWGVHNWTRGHAAFRVLEQQIDSDRLKSIEGMKEGILDCAKSAGASPLALGHRCVRHGQLVTDVARVDCAARNCFDRGTSRAI